MKKLTISAAIVLFFVCFSVNALTIAQKANQIAGIRAAANKAYSDNLSLRNKALSGDHWTGKDDRAWEHNMKVQANAASAIAAVQNQATTTVSKGQPFSIKTAPAVNTSKSKPYATINVKDPVTGQQISASFNSFFSVGKKGGNSNGTGTRGMRDNNGRGADNAHSHAFGGHGYGRDNSRSEGFGGHSHFH